MGGSYYTRLSLGGSFKLILQIIVTLDLLVLNTNSTEYTSSIIMAEVVLPTFAIGTFLAPNHAFLDLVLWD